MDFEFKPNTRLDSELTFAIEEPDNLLLGKAVPKMPNPEEVLSASYILVRFYGIPYWASIQQVTEEGILISRIELPASSRKGSFTAGYHFFAGLENIERVYKVSSHDSSPIPPE